MTYAQLVAWTWHMMLVMQPANVTPWASTYEETAIAFVDEATQLPLFGGKTGIEETVSLFLSVAWFEGRFDPKAEGDCVKKDGKCVSQSASLCTFQIGRSNLKALNIAADEILGDIKVCTHAARTMMKISFGVCKGHPKLELLGHYASGGNVCGGLKESRHRMQKANWIFSQRGQ